MTSSSAGSVLIGVAYLLLVVFLLLFCGWRTTTFDDFAKYWGLFGTIVGVVTGVIPAYFFKVKADASDARAADADRRADREAQKAQLYAAAAAAPEAQQVSHDHRELFEA